MDPSKPIDPKVVEALPIELLRTIPGGLPPPNIKANFDDPDTRVPAILGLGSTFLAIALICYSLRMYMKIAVVKAWKWDDLSVTVTLGFMCSIVYFAVTVNGCIHGSAGRHEWDLHLDKILSKATLDQSYVTVIMVTPALGLIKTSLFIQYYQLFNVRRYVRLSVYIGATLSAVFYIVVSIIAFVLTSPWPGQSAIENILSWHYLKFAEFSVPTGVIGMLVDWILLILPIPAIWQLHLTMTKKIGVLLIFLTGGLATAASMVSLYYRVQLQNDISDSTWKVGYVLLWSQVEMYAGVTASSMPTVKQFFVRHNILPKLRSSYLEPKLKSINIFSNKDGSGKTPHIDLTFGKWLRGTRLGDEEHELSVTTETSVIRDDLYKSNASEVPTLDLHRENSSKLAHSEK